MHKTELAKKIARYTDLDERASLAMLNFILAEIASSLKKGKRVTLTGFGTFEIRRRKKRNMKNTITKEMIVVPAHKAVGFKPSEPLKWSLRK